MSALLAVEYLGLDMRFRETLLVCKDAIEESKYMFRRSMAVLFGSF